jgi:hypothetical protein
VRKGEDDPFATYPNLKRLFEIADERAFVKRPA